MTVPMATFTYGRALEEQIYLFRELSEKLQGRSDQFTPEVRNYLRILREIVGRAHPFFWSSDICDIVQAGAEQKPEWSPTAALLPVTWGFCWFEKAIILPKPDIKAVNRPIALKAFGWATDPNIPDGIGVASFCELPDKTLRPNISDFWNYNDPPSAMAREHITYLDPKVEKDAYAYKEYDTEASNFQFYVMATCWAFLNQRLLVTTPHQPTRSSRHRAERAGLIHESLLHVVHLRRQERPSVFPDSSDEKPIYSYRWIVRGHWRQQACGCERRERRPVWVTPHVKGPPDKPLKKPATTIFAVVR